jgi:hypothetical protein
MPSGRGYSWNNGHFAFGLREPLFRECLNLLICKGPHDLTLPWGQSPFTKLSLLSSVSSVVVLLNNAITVGNRHNTVASWDSTIILLQASFFILEQQWWASQNRLQLTTLQTLPPTRVRRWHKKTLAGAGTCFLKATEVDCVFRKKPLCEGNQSIVMVFRNF